MYNLDGVALSGSLLASLLNEAASPYAGSEMRKVRQQSVVCILNAAAPCGTTAAVLALRVKREEDRAPWNGVQQQCAGWRIDVAVFFAVGGLCAAAVFHVCEGTCQITRASTCYLMGCRKVVERCIAIASDSSSSHPNQRPPLSASSEHHPTGVSRTVCRCLSSLRPFVNASNSRSRSLPAGTTLDVQNTNGAIRG